MTNKAARVSLTARQLGGCCRSVEHVCVSGDVSIRAVCWCYTNTLNKWMLLYFFSTFTKTNHRFHRGWWRMKPHTLPRPPSGPNTPPPPVEEAHKLDCVLKPTRFNIGVIREGCSFDGDSSLSPRAPVNAADWPTLVWYLIQNILLLLDENTASPAFCGCYAEKWPSTLNTEKIFSSLLDRFQAGNRLFLCTAWRL